MTLFLDVRASAVGGVLAGGVALHDETAKQLDVRALEDGVQGRDVLLVAHGFNVDRAAGISHLSWWEKRLQLPSVLFVGILWPGDSAFIPAIDYPIEGNEAMGAGRMLAPFLDAHLVGATSVSFASHSLGARVVLETIQRMATPIRSLTMMAGAIDNTCLTGEYSAAVPKVGRISVLASHKDAVLDLAFPLGNFLGGILSRGHPYVREALGRDGPANPFPRTVGSRWQIPDGWDYGHGDYFGTAAAQGPLIDAPVDVPAPGTPAPTTPADWRPAWSAAFAASRM
jgi:hypothetical protein